ncbi:MAG: hypothetical protein AAGF01_22025 [Cyanobacteria bacterium P01_G01_bin.38]
MARGQIPPARQSVDKGDAYRLESAITSALRTALLLKALLREKELPPRGKKEPRSQQVEIEKDQGQVEAQSPRWLNPATEGERLAIAPGEGVKQLPMSYLEEAAYLNGIDPKLLPPTGDGIGAYALAPSRDGGGSVELSRDRPDVLIHVKVGDELVLGSPDDISDNIADQMSEEHQQILVDAIEDRPVSQRVSIFAVDQSNPSNQVAFFRESELDQGWTASNGHDEIHLSSREAREGVEQMGSPASQQLRAAIGEAVQGDAYIEGPRFNIHVQGKDVVVTDKTGRQVSPERLSEISERASDVASQANSLPSAGLSQGVNSAIDDGPQIDREMEL